MYSASKHAVKGFTDALRVEVMEVENANVSITLIQPTAVNTPYPQHAKNYMSEEPKLPSPQIEPTDVAQATLSAATSPARDVKVGGMSKLNTTVAKLFPSLGDKMAAKQVDRQNYDEAPRNPDGTLYRAGESGRTHGSGGTDPQPDEIRWTPGRRRSRHNQPRSGCARHRSVERNPSQTPQVA